MKYNEKMGILEKAEIVVGVDIGKDTHVISIIEKNGKEVLIGKKVENSREGFDFLKATLSPWKSKSVVVAMEPTGHYWKSLGYQLEDSGYKVVLINPYHTKQSKEIYDNQRGKTDKKDSKLIAQLAREGKFMGCRLLRGEYLELRKLSMIRETVAKELERSLTRMSMLLDEYLPEYSGQFCSLLGVTSQKLLKEYGIKGLRNKEKGTFIEKSITTASRGKISSARAEQIVSNLSQSIGVTEGLDSAEITLQVLIRQVESHANELKGLNKAIEEKAKETEEGEFLIAIKGVGALTAGIFLGETGRLKDYTSFKQVEKLAGLDLVENSSGKHLSQKKISKRGRTLLRHVLFRIGLVSVKWNDDFRKIYQYKVEVLKKTKMSALTSVISKILRVMFNVGRNQLMYDGRLVLKGLAY